MKRQFKKAVLVLSCILVAWLLWNVLPKRRDDDQGQLGRPLRVGIVSWPGYAGGIVANNGFPANKKCLFWKNHKLLVEFVLLEEATVLTAEFTSKKVDVIWTTVDSLATQLPSFQERGISAKAFMQVDWSRGGDAIVADQSITSIEMLAGKKVALALLTPSHWFLEAKLRSSKLSSEEQSGIVKNMIAKDSSPDARTVFTAGSADAAVVWEPDVSAALKQRKGSQVIASTRTDPFLLADVMVAQTPFIESHKEVLTAFINGWFEGSQLAESNHALVAELLVKWEPLYTDLGLAVTKDQLSTVRWANLEDNIDMFGLDGKTAKFQSIYTEAGEVWLKGGYIKSILPPDAAVDTSLLKAIISSRKH